MRLRLELDGYRLFERPDASADGWHSFKLVATRPSVKRIWWLGWNGRRLAKNADTQKLIEHLPQVHGEVLKFLEANYGAQ